MTPKILWEKWINPYELPPEEGKLLEDIDPSDFEELNNWNTYEDNEKDGENLNNNNDYEVMAFKNQTKAIITPMGMIPLNEQTACTKTFKFWIGHTNFTISEKHKNIIENTEGVETLDVFTRYRFRIAIGKAFQDRDIMQNIQGNLYEKL